VTESRPAAFGWVMAALAAIALGGALFAMGRSALLTPEVTPLHAVVRLAALVFSVAYALGQGWAFRELSRAAQDDNRMPGGLRPLVLGLLKRMGYGALSLSLLALVVWIPFMREVGAWRVLFAAEAMAAFLAVSVGLTALAIRACLDYAARAEGDPATMLLFVRFGFILLALGYLTAHWLRPPNSEAEILATNLGLGIALLFLGLNRMGGIPGSALSKLR